MPVFRCVILTADSVLLTFCPPRTAGTESVDADVLGFDLDAHVLVDHGRDRASAKDV